MYKSAEQVADDVLRRNFEKQGVLARLYALGRGTEEALRRLPRINVGGPRGLVTPVSAREAFGDVARRFRAEDIAARHAIAKKLGPPTFEAADIVYRTMGLPRHARKRFGLSVAGESPLWFTAPLPFPYFLGPQIASNIPAQVAWSGAGPAVSLVKRVARIPVRKDLIEAELQRRARQKGFKSLEQKLLFEEPRGYLPSEVAKATKRLGRKIKRHTLYSFPPERLPYA